MLEMELNGLWREYSKLYPQELRSAMWSAMARAVACGDEEALCRLTGEGFECGGHTGFLDMFRALVRDYWRLATPPNQPRGDA